MTKLFDALRYNFSLQVCLEMSETELGIENEIEKIEPDNEMPDVTHSLKIMIYQSRVVEV